MLLLALSALLTYLFRANLTELGTFFSQIGGTVVSTYSALNPPTPVRLPAPPTVPQSSATAKVAGLSQYTGILSIVGLALVGLFFVVRYGGGQRRR